MEKPDGLFEIKTLNDNNKKKLPFQDSHEVDFTFDFNVVINKCNF